MKAAILFSCTMFLGACSIEDSAAGTPTEFSEDGGANEVYDFEKLKMELEQLEAKMGIATSPLAAAGPPTNIRGYRVISWHGPASQSCEPGRRPAKSITHYTNNRRDWTVAYTECGQIYSNNYNFWFTQVGRFAGDALLLAEAKLPVTVGPYDHADFTSDDPENVISDYGSLRTVACYGDCRSLPPQPE